MLLATGRRKAREARLVFVTIPLVPRLRQIFVRYVRRDEQRVVFLDVGVPPGRSPLRDADVHAADGAATAAGVPSAAHDLAVRVGPPLPRGRHDGASSAARAVHTVGDNLDCQQISWPKYDNYF